MRSLWRRTLEDPDSSGKVIDPPGGLESSNDDRGGRNQVVSEGVVQVALRRLVFVQALGLRTRTCSSKTS